MSFDKPDCFFREEQIWNNVFDLEKQIIRVQTKNKSVPKIERIEISNKDVEHSFVFPKGVTSFSIRDRGGSRMRYSYQAGEVENTVGEFIDMGPHAIYKETDINRNTFDDLIIYFSSSRDNRIVELTYWT